MLFVLFVSSLVAFSIVLLDVNNIFVNLFLSIVLIAAIYLSLKNNRERVIHSQADNVWVLGQGESTLNAQLLDGSVVTPLFVILNFRCDNGKYKKEVIFKDSLEFDVYRKLRVKLKVEGVAPISRDTL